MVAATSRRQYFKTAAVGVLGFVLGSVAQGAIQKFSNPAIDAAGEWVRRVVSPGEYFTCITTDQEPPITVCLNEQDNNIYSINGQVVSPPPWRK